MNKKVLYVHVDDGTIPSCIGKGKPEPPNTCETCRRHSDVTCEDVKISQEQSQK